MAKIGILGGTFDPIHNGHILLGRQAYEEYRLDQIWFMPSGSPPHKKDHRVSAGKLRRDMVLLAIEGVPYFVYSDFELKRPGNTYTAQTLKLLCEAFPGNAYYFIVGADSLYQIEHWYHPEQVMSGATLLVAGREYGEKHRSLDRQIAHLASRFNAQIQKLHCGELDISSADLRQMAARGLDISSYVPYGVAEYIRANGLYQTSETGIN